MGEDKPVVGRTSADVASEALRALGKLGPTAIIVAGVLFALYQFYSLTTKQANEKMMAAQNALIQTYESVGNMAKKQLDNVETLLDLNARINSDIANRRGELEKLSEDVALKTEELREREIALREAEDDRRKAIEEQQNLKAEMDRIDLQRKLAEEALNDLIRKIRQSPEESGEPDRPVVTEALRVGATSAEESLLFPDNLYIRFRGEIERATMEQMRGDLMKTLAETPRGEGRLKVTGVEKIDGNYNSGVVYFKDSDRLVAERVAGAAAEFFKAARAHGLRSPDCAGQFSVIKELAGEEGVESEKGRVQLWVRAACAPSTLERAEAAEEQGFRLLAEGRVAESREAFAMAERIYPTLRSNSELVRFLREYQGGFNDLSEKQRVLEHVLKRYAWHLPQQPRQVLEGEIERLSSAGEGLSEPKGTEAE